MQAAEPSPDVWPRAEQLAEFARATAALRRRIGAELGGEDLRHLRKVERWGRLCTLVGYAAAPWGVNPLAVLGISQGVVTRWLLMHHIGHRGYDRVPGVPPRYTSQVFARGWRRFVDWFDWILPEAWKFEHNVLHHGYTGEHADPDLVERHVADSPLTCGPRPLRYLLVAFFALTWKISYYAPNTFVALENARRRRRGEAPVTRWWTCFSPLHALGRDFWRRCLLPYGLARFAAVPLLCLPLGRGAALCVLCNSLLAELCTNVHTFMVIAPNHAGDDLYRFDAPEQGRAQHLARQVMGSVNYRCGGDVNDFAHMWLNYQIDHHVWPDLPMRQYQRHQPALRALCAAAGLPYVQQGVLARCGKLVDIMVGRRAMRRAGPTSSRAGSPPQAREAATGSAGSSTPPQNRVGAAARRATKVLTPPSSRRTR